jgi:signal transduction histidine kinase
VPAQFVPRLFERFARAPGSGGTGTGLGLFIARGLVEAHGGRIWALSEPSRGTEVRFRLPRGGQELAGLE